jgi:predicted ATPase
MSEANELEAIRARHEKDKKTIVFEAGWERIIIEARRDRETLLRLLDAAMRGASLAKISAWTDDDQRGLNAAVADTMWHWDTRAERPLDPDDAVSLTEALKIHLKDNGFQIVRLATALAKDATT